MADEEDDDDLFGDFKFVSSYTNGNTLDFEDQEDDWGDFIDNNTGDKPHHHIQTSEKKIWHKPQGVLPLSIFGDQDDDKFDSNSIDHFFNDSFKNVSTVKNGFNYGSGINLNDLYNQDQSNSDSVNQIVDLDEDGWEFKDASSGEVEVSSIKAAETTTTIITSDNMIQAVKNLCSAVGLYEHASSMVNILTLGSLEDKYNYVTTWSRMILACSQELKHGASIWKQSLQKNAHTKILSKFEGQQYVVALGEIYRVVEVLRASTRVYKAWILSTHAGPTNIFALLEECDAIWSGSRLEDALMSISDPVSSRYEGTVKELLESIKFVHALNEHDIQSHAFSLKGPICRFSLLPLTVVQGMKTVVWNGECYFLTLANFWANCLSCDPPNLPQIFSGP